MESVYVSFTYVDYEEGVTISHNKLIMCFIFLFDRQVDMIVYHMIGGTTVKIPKEALAF